MNESYFGSAVYGALALALIALSAMTQNDATALTYVTVSTVLAWVSCYSDYCVKQWFEQPSYVSPWWAVFVIGTTALSAALALYALGRVVFS